MNKSIFQLGPYYSGGIWTDVKKSMITLARYKFCTKMLEYVSGLKVLELGCNEGLGAYFFMQMPNCVEYLGCDINKQAIEWGLDNVKPQAEKYEKRVEFMEANFLSPLHLEKKFNAIISLDVIEHIEHNDEQTYVKTIVQNIEDNGIAIIGTPNIRMREYQSEATRKEHVNMFDQARLFNLLHTAFQNVFMFSMNDEVVHTGFEPMSCYFFALCCAPIK